MDKEKIVDYLAGIMEVMGGGSIARGYEFLGAGKIITSENAAIITNQRIIFITVPIPGAETMVMGIDIPMWEWIAAKKEIENKLKEMLSSMTIEQILNSNPKNFYVDYSNIERIKFGNFTHSIKIFKRDGKKLKYSIRDVDDFQKAKQLFANYTRK